MCTRDDASIGAGNYRIQIKLLDGDFASVRNNITITSGQTTTWTYNAADSTITSTDIDEDELVTLTLEDKNGCNTVTFTGLTTQCSCPANGQLSLASNTICPGDSTDLTVTFENTLGTASNMSIRLFDGSAKIDSALNLTDTPNPNTVTFRVGKATTYSATIEHLGQTCTVTGDNQEVLAHYDSLKAVIRNDADVCANGDSTSSITVEVTGNTGQGPYSYYYSVNNTLNTTPETITTGNVGSFESAVLPVGTTADQVYRLDSLEDANGCKAIAQNLTGEATISPIALPEADISERTATVTKIQTAEATQVLNDGNTLLTDYTRLWEVRAGTPPPVTLATLSTTTGTPVTVSGLEKEKIVEVILTISDDGGVCPVAKDSILIERVDETIPNAGLDTSVCVGSGVTRVGNSVVDAVNESVRWYKAGAPSVDLSVNETLTVAPASLTTAGSPHVYVYETTNNISSTVRTDSFAITVIALPVADIVERTATVTKIQTADPTQDLNDANVLPTDYTRLWEVRASTPAPVTLATLSTTTGTPVTVSGLEKEKIVEVVLTISDDGGVCPVAKDSILIERVDETVPNAGADTSICVGNGVTRVGNSVVDAVNESVRWYKAGAPSVDLSVNETLTVAPASLTTAGSPHVYVYETTNSISNTVRTDSFAITVIAMPVAVISGYADGATITTNTLPVVLQQGAALPSGYTGTWFYENTVTIPTGGNGVGTPTNPTSISVDGLEFEESGEAKYKVSDIGGVCPSDSSIVTIERKNITEACARDTILCLASPVYTQAPCSTPANVGAGAPTEESAEWIAVGTAPTPGTVSAPNYELNVTFADTGTYQYIYRIYNSNILGGTGTPIESRKTITIKVLDVPVVSSATLTGDSFGCQDTVKTYTVAGVLNAESYAWTLPTGFTFEGGTPSTTTTAKVVLGGTTGGDITIRATNRCGFKDTLIDVSTIYLRPTGGTVASNVSYCPSDDSVYTFRLTTAPTSVLPLTYLWDIDGGDLESPNLTSDTVQVSFENKTGTQTISLVPKNACGEPKTVSDLPNTVTATQTPAISASVDLGSSLADDVTYCIDDTDDITFTATASNAGATPTYTFYQGLVEIQASSTDNTVAVPKSTIADQDVIRVEMVGTPGVCYTSSSDDDQLIMDGYKQPVVAITSDFAEVCEQGTPDRIVVTATVSSATSKGVNEMTIFRGGTTAKFESSTLPTTFSELSYTADRPSHTGTYTATAKNDVCPISDVSNSVDAKIWEQPQIIGVVTQDQGDTVIIPALIRRSIKKGEILDIGVEALMFPQAENGNYTYYWTTALAANENVIEFGTSKNANIHLEQELIDNIVLEVTNGLCVDSKEYLLQALYPLNVPNAFSPNGDGVNDVWQISGLADFELAVVSVFNRWGNKIFEETNYTDSNAWNGKGSPVGTYYYIIKLNKKGWEVPLTGAVTITR